MKTYGVVMAGGGGTRLWPLSTKKMPKQFLNLSGKETLVNEAVDRLLGVAGKEDIFYCHQCFPDGSHAFPDCGACAKRSYPCGTGGTKHGSLYRLCGCDD